MRRSPAILAGAICVTSAAALLGGCGATYVADQGVLSRVADGEFGDARVRAAQAASQAPRDDLLTRLKSLQLTLAEGLPAGSEADAIDAQLRDQGTNEQRNAALVLAGERLSRVWKGEPFEQAMARYYLAVNDAVAGDWGNARASMADARFLMEEFSPPPDDPQDAASEPFVLGLALQTLASGAIGEREEVRDLADRLRSVRPDLAPIADAGESGFTTLLIVDVGLGPEKVAYGGSGERTEWVPRERSSDAPVHAETLAGGSAPLGPVEDVNRLAAQSDWTYLQGTRVAKSAVGDAMILGGAITTQASDDSGARLAGVVAVGLGALLKSSARADLRHLETMPQRVYLVPLDLPPGSHEVALSIPGVGQPAIVLPVVPAGTRDAPVASYVRLPIDRPAWATSGQVRYANNADPEGDYRPEPLDRMPYILGGRDVRTPSRAVYEDYIDAGWPTSVPYQSLIDAYREEGITIVEGAARNVEPGRHVLEQGHLLYTPRAGSTAYVRLFAREHAAYEPRSEFTRTLSSEIRAALAPSPTITQGKP